MAREMYVNASSAYEDTFPVLCYTLIIENKTDST